MTAGASVIEGNGGSDGVVLSLQLQSSSAYEAVYTISVAIGDSSNIFSLQVDTGSSDLWVASSACSSSSCNSVGNGNLYNPSSAKQTGYGFNITYLQGSVSGPIVWDHVDVGGYAIDNQALAAATVVNSEPLSSNYQGILGLALPLNSVIAKSITPVTGNSPDGAAWASNLFSLTPVSSSPASHFLSLSLERPGSNRIPSLLGIGHHPSSLVPDPSKIHYYPLIGNSMGVIYWKVAVRAITVYVDSQPRPVEIDSTTGAPYPTAVLDSGVPVILTTTEIANGIYGAIGIGPASNGNYYVPCTTPLNMSITLQGGAEIPLHPLDLTSEPPNNNRAEYCIGMIQSSSVLEDPSSGIGEIILGVPFLRNTYTVMSYDTPYPNGSFPSPSHSSTNSGMPDIQPSLGLLSLTNATIALEEFQTVRVFNQPLSSGNQTGGPISAPITVGPRRLSVGIIVLVALVGFFSLCFALFGVRWFLLRRRFGRGGGEEEEEEEGVVREGRGEDKIEMGVLAGGDVDSEKSLVGPGGSDKTKNGSYTAIDVGLRRSSEEEREGDGVVLRLRTAMLPSSDRVVSEYTASSARTRVGADDLASIPEEFGQAAASRLELKESPGSAGSRWSLADDPVFRRSIRVSEGSGQHQVQQEHERNPSLVVPLLAHRHSQSVDAEIPPPEDVNEDRGGPSVAREFGVRQSWSVDGVDSRTDNGSDVNSMAGIGTARARMSQFESLEFPRQSFLSAGGTIGLGTASEEEERWIPSYPPPSSQQADILEEAREDEERDQFEETEEQEEQRQGQQELSHPPSPPIPLSPPPPLLPRPATPTAFIPSGAGHPVYPRVSSTSALEDTFDPYVESVPR